jgi:DNA primase
MIPSELVEPMPAKTAVIALELKSFVKTTCKTGLHVCVLVKKTLGFEEAKSVCEIIGRHVVAAHPNEVTMEWSIPKRSGMTFIDHHMNGRGRGASGVGRECMRRLTRKYCPIWCHSREVIP